MPVFRLTDALIFPNPEFAEPDGLLAIGGDLSPSRLIMAYTQGIFPWFSEDDPTLWWSPTPRLVLFPDEFHLPKRLRRTITAGTFTVTADTALFSVFRRPDGKKTHLAYNAGSAPLAVRFSDGALMTVPPRALGED